MTENTSGSTGLNIDKSQDNTVSKPSPYSRIGICKFCGKVTDDWTIHYGLDGLCICRKCNALR